MSFTDLYLSCLIKLNYPIKCINISIKDVDTIYIGVFFQNDEYFNKFRNILKKH